MAMSNIRVNTTELLQLLDLIPASHNIMLVGRHGIGKSEILTEYFNSRGMPVVPLFLGQMADPRDLIGIPARNEKTGKTDFMPPYWFPLDGKPIVLFLDELNRARPEILQTIMDLALNRTLAGRRLPEGSRIISAVNEGDRYQLTDLDPALVSRFDIVNFQPTVQEWLLWAGRNGVDRRVMDFIEDNPVWLDRNPDMKENEDTGLDKTPDRRAWKRVSDIISGVETVTPVHQKAIAAIVGAKATVAFRSSVTMNRLASGKDVLYSFHSVRDRIDGYSLHELSTVNDSIFRCLEVEKVTETDMENVKQNLVDYFECLTGSHKEAAAHFANLYVRQTYPKAVAFMARECRTLTITLVRFVKGLK